MGLIEALGPGPTALDTMNFTYLIEEHEEYLPLLLPLFEEADAGERELMTSALTLLEVLVVPYRAGDLSLVERYELLLSESRGLTLVEIDRSQLRGAAELRATYGVRTPDGLQLAAALAGRCGSFLTNDRDLPEIPGLEVLQLSNFAS